MGLDDYLQERHILGGYLASVPKNDAILTIVNHLAEAGGIIYPKGFYEDVIRREEIDSTGLGHGVAFPHARTAYVERIVVGIGRSRDGIGFDAIDGKPVHLVCLIGTPREDVQTYLALLADLSRILKDKGNRHAVLDAGSPAEILRIFNAATHV